MSDDYLKQLADWINENGRQRKEEDMAFSERVNKQMNIPLTSSQRFPLTKQLAAQNPDLPQDDLQDYAQNVKDDEQENMMQIGGMSGGLKMLKPAAQAGMKFLPKIAPKVAEALDNAPRYAKDLAEEYLPKSISSKVDDLYYGSKAKDNIAKFTNAKQDSARLSALQDLANKTPVHVAPELDDAGKAAASKSTMIQALIESAKTDAENLAKSIKADPKKLKEAMEKTITSTGTGSK
jgi:hypothetical protein